MAMIQFTRNHTDHSNDTGFQFEFQCDKCSNGFMSRFEPHKLGITSNILRAAGGLLGGFFGNAGYATRRSRMPCAARRGTRPLQPRWRKASST